MNLICTPDVCKVGRGDRCWETSISAIKKEHERLKNIWHGRAAESNEQRRCPRILINLPFIKNFFSPSNYPPRKLLNFKLLKFHASRHFRGHPSCPKFPTSYLRHRMALAANFKKLPPSPPPPPPPRPPWITIWSKFRRYRAGFPRIHRANSPNARYHPIRKFKLYRLHALSEPWIFIASTISPLADITKRLRHGQPPSLPFDSRRLEDPRSLASECAVRRKEWRKERGIFPDAEKHAQWLTRSELAEATGRRFLFLAAVSRPRNNGASLPVFAAARFPDEGFAEIYFSLVVRSSAKKKFVRTDTLTAPVGTDTANFDGTFSLVFLGFCLLCAFARAAPSLCNIARGY